MFVITIIITSLTKLYFLNTVRVTAWYTCTNNDEEVYL